ncbi:myelin protein zero-like protein 3 [Sardina pilchardus]|uniref:myelin protein zero-like protein 3 n=1 Tax=Sardina pilchardus TaxID=27697 RepID=UPI002E0DAAF1
MDLREPVRISLNRVLFECLVLITVLSSVSSIKVSAPSEIAAVRGQDVTLSCSFTSSSGPTSRMSVDWSFTPADGGVRQSMFHFYGTPFPPVQGPFKDRIKWLGSPSRGEATIQLLNATLADNGTYTCSVKNPPDTHGAPSQTVLTVTPKKVTIRLSEVMVLLLFVLVPSAVIGMALLCRILCPCCPQGETPPKGQGYHSSIEVTERDMYDYKHPAQREKTPTCCEMWFTDSDGEEDEYHLHHPVHHQKGEGMEESQC